MIAREESLGESTGEFFQQADGKIYNREKEGAPAWYVNRNMPTFFASAAAFNKYCDTVTQTPDELEQERLVSAFRDELERLEPVGAPGTCFWSLIIEQMEHGLL